MPAGTPPPDPEPDPDAAQRTRALAAATRVRTARAGLRREIRDGRTTVASVLAHVPHEARTMPVADLLLAQRYWGKVRTRRLLQAVPVSDVKQVAALTERQRQLIIDLLGG